MIMYWKLATAFLLNVKVGRRAVVSYESNSWNINTFFKVKKHRGKVSVSFSVNYQLVGVGWTCIVPCDVRNGEPLVRVC